MKKRFFAALLAVAMTLTMSACSSGGADYTVGICQLAPHPALDAATKGFKDTLTELAAADGKTIEFQEQNANGEATTCGTIINGFVSSKVDLILANATAPLQTAASSTDSIPILGTSISSYGTALEEPDMGESTGRNISGTSDLAPLDEQAAIVKEWFPDAKNVGLLFCSGEANSRYQIDMIKPHLEALGFTCTEFTFSDSNDLATVTTNACQNSDVIYVPTDNTVADNTGIIANIAIPANVPVIAGEEATCSGCGVATLSISYEELGQTTGEMAYEVLVKGADISAMPIQFAPSVTKKYNPTICEQMGLTPLEGYIAIETAE
ncbi:MAG: ABC transporter substrate-binding protein [Ruminococcaceae bacterium]|nr:ABC transporter substrate-binding protein [Oscillospiraceae bacterium]MBQ9969296.1 ABC transporter substrate-binding protein [Oscillospiraceae bacterium]